MPKEICQRRGDDDEQKLLMAFARQLFWAEAWVEPMRKFFAGELNTVAANTIIRRKLANVDWDTKDEMDDILKRKSSPSVTSGHLDILPRLKSGDSYR